MRTQIKATLAALSCLWLSSCQSPGRLSHQQLGSVDKLETVRFFYPSAGGNIEAYVVRPDGEGPFPLVILLHGHSFMAGAQSRCLQPRRPLRATFVLPAWPYRFLVMGPAKPSRAPSKTPPAADFRKRIC